MDTSKLLEIIERGEDSRHQFKRNIHNDTSMASELAAFSNAQGGLLIIGVDHDGTVAGLSNKDIGRLNNMISNVSSSHIRNPINPSHKNITLDGKLVMMVTVPEGLDKPYITNDGATCADKRKSRPKKR